ncbi:MAG: DUF5947 family protein [Terriglobales bacterium]
MAALRRWTRPAAATGAAVRCELCSQALEPRHEHLLALASGELSCACTACALLFDRADAAYQRLGRDRRFLQDFDFNPLEWASLAVPVQLAFFRRRAAVTVAAYPSPAGLVRADVAEPAWAALSARHGALAAMAPEIEALIANRMEQPHRYFIVPLDDAYELAGLVRQLWRGFTGGAEVRHRIREFCIQLASGAAHA